MTPPKLCGDCGTQMDVNPDLFALPGMDVTSQGLSFNLGRALPVTVYVCPNCGRFKFMSAMMLGNIEQPEPSNVLTEPETAPADAKVEAVGEQLKTPPSDR